MTRKQEPAVVGKDLEGAKTVGCVLRERRRSRGLTLEQVEAAIRIGARHILAVEDGRLDRLPPPPYGRGLVRAYATLLGSEPEELLRVCGGELSAGSSGGPARIFRVPIRERVTRRDFAVPIALALAVAMIVVARTMLAPEPVELVAPVDVPVVAPRPIQPAAAPEDLIPGPGPAEPPGGVPGVRVILRSEGTSWVEAAADGGELHRYDLGPGQNLELIARERLALSLEDAGVVRVQVGERELGFIGYKGETKTGLSFTAQKFAGGAVARPGSGD